MSYNTVSAMAYDGHLLQRVTACAALEETPSPVQWASERGWQFAAQPGWAAAYASAIATGTTDPGKDEAVITDAMILSAVQSLRSTP